MATPRIVPSVSYGGFAINGPVIAPDLTREGGAVHSAQSTESLTVVPSKVGVKALLGIYPQELAHHLDGQNFRVAKLGRRTTLAWRLLSLDPIVGQAEKTAVMKMLRSTRAETSSLLAGLNHRQA